MIAILTNAIKKLKPVNQRFKWEESVKLTLNVLLEDIVQVPQVNAKSFNSKVLLAQLLLTQFLAHADMEEFALTQPAQMHSLCLWELMSLTLVTIT